MRQRRDMSGYRGGRVRKRGRKIAPFTGTRGGFNTSVFMPYVTKPPRSPRGTAAGGLLRDCCGAAATSLRGRGLLLRGCCYGNGRSETGGRAAPRERGTGVTGANVPKSPHNPINN